MDNWIRLLIADANQEYTQMIKECCERTQNIQVVAMATDGEQALCDVLACHPDVILTDIVMPHLDGLGLLERVQALDLSPRPRCMVVSLLTNDRVMRMALASGAMYFLAKPVNMELLARRVVEVYQDVPLPPTSNRKWTPADNEITGIVTELIQSLGVPVHLNGYKYIRDTLVMTVQDEELLSNLSVRIYPVIARKYNTRPNSVERCIRHAIETAWDRKSPAARERMFGYTILPEKGKPTNREFLAMLTDHITLQL